MFKKTIQSQLPFVFLGKFSDQPSSLAASSSSPDLWNEVCFARIWCSFVGTWEDAESGPCAHSSWEWEAGVSFDLPAQADTLHCANKVLKPSLLACLPSFFFFFLKEKQTRTICMFLLNSSVTQDPLTAIPHLKEAPLLSFSLLAFLPPP